MMNHSKSASVFSELYLWDIYNYPYPSVIHLIYYTNLLRTLTNQLGSFSIHMYDRRMGEVSLTRILIRDQGHCSYVVRNPRIPFLPLSTYLHLSTRKIMPRPEKKFFLFTFIHLIIRIFLPQWRQNCDRKYGTNNLRGRCNKSK